MVHADTLTLLGNLLADDKQAQCDIYLALTKRLAAAGADNVVVTSIAGHFCIDRFAEVSPLPVIDLKTPGDMDTGTLRRFHCGTKFRVESTKRDGIDGAFGRRVGERQFQVIFAHAARVTQDDIRDGKSRGRVARAIWPRAFKLFHKVWCCRFRHQQTVQS